MAHLCEQNTPMMSVDNKNKVEVGIPATSRRTNIRTYHMVDQAPIYNDHDFPNPNAKLVPTGYQILRHSLKRRRSVSPPRILKVKRKRSLSEGDLDEPQNLCKDKLGRNKIKWPCSGPLLVQLYPSRVIESTNVMHVIWKHFDFERFFLFLFLTRGYFFTDTLYKHSLKFTWKLTGE